MLRAECKNAKRREKPLFLERTFADPRTNVVIRLTPSYGVDNGGARNDLWYDARFSSRFLPA